jgi:hypothetical protein
VEVVDVAPQSLDAARMERALDRLADHCEVVARLTAHVDERRLVVRERLEQELGAELTQRLLTGLVAA